MSLPCRLQMLEKEVLHDLLQFLNLDDRIHLGATSRFFKQVIFDANAPWSGQSLLFPPNDNRISDSVATYFMKSIPRSFAVTKLQLVGLPLTDTAILGLLDRFAHALEHIELILSPHQLSNLCDHLEAFSYNLALLQSQNGIPHLFGEYANEVHEAKQRVATILEAKETTASDEYSLSRLLSRFGLPTELDDPPFERLAIANIRCQVQDSLIKSDRVRRSDLESMNMAVTRARSFVAYLAGHDVGWAINRASGCKIDFRQFKCEKCGSEYLAVDANGSPICTGACAIDLTMNRHVKRKSALDDTFALYEPDSKHHHSVPSSSSSSR
ncbi:hypothetical protein K450DRAFT_231504 [Umbelopsis ramanniana AG]|uniref:F-box domain-containing protein n=1 Tax=Umbelopsis ramanniana AG TaxID=1314678 RepID=A0AAD5ED19_UMBRA|nr:uncharacterized protein K450DRAFT_231504 [Umbelopsis ramanniana AG]KAI8581483.1 hypothetical protein K450DRAFT_231504 [Umbelopsis ramanniana AG]